MTPLLLVNLPTTDATSDAANQVSRRSSSRFDVQILLANGFKSSTSPPRLENLKHSTLNHRKPIAAEEGPRPQVFEDLDRFTIAWMTILPMVLDHESKSYLPASRQSTGSSLILALIARKLVTFGA
jgi:hypothetical protein